LLKKREVENNKSFVAKQFWPKLNDITNGVADVDDGSLHASVRNIIALVKKVNDRFDNR
jgi:hypothetical protein